MSNRYSASKLREIRALGSHYAPGNNYTRQWHPIYNISPKCEVPVVVKGKEQPLRLMRWGTWTIDGLLANELADTIATKAAWKSAVQHRRCLILADGFFEWETMGPWKFAHYFTVTVRDAFPMAGIWMPANDDQPERCIMVSTKPNELVATFDDRMPAILSDWDAIEWLGDKPLPPGAIGRLCQPYPAEKLSHWASPQTVSRTTFQDPSAIRPVPQNPSNN
ncbi:MAG TPA: SOS response-associated peptidase family protein [Lacunisphaera sp.]|jgi:putative SOS response-associated peptidase YedK